MNSIDFSNYILDEADGVFTYKNENTTLGFVRFNKKGEVEYIFVNPIFRKQGLYIGLIGCGIGGSLGFILCWLQQEFGLIKLSSAFIINAYPVDIRLLDVTIILLGSLFLCLAESWFPSKRAYEI